MDTTASSARKDMGIETLRGIAIILMVAGHVVGDRSDAGMEVADDSIYRYLYFTLEPLRMPLFTVLSGFVYSLRPVRTGASRAFLRGKLRRILIPLLCVSTLQYLVRVVMPGIHHSVPLAGIWSIYVFPFDQFWFLQALLLVFLCVALLELRGMLSHVRGLLGCFALALALELAHLPIPDVFSLSEFFYLLPFFLLGCGIQRFPSLFRDPRLLCGCAAVFLAGVAVGQLAWFGILDADTRAGSPLGVVIAASGNVLLLRWRRPLPALPWLGGYSYSIYLLHVFGTAGGRMAIHRVGDVPQLEVFAVSLLLGLGLPILADRLLPSRLGLRRALLGQAPRSRPATAPGGVVPAGALPAVLPPAPAVASPPGASGQR